MKNTEKQKQEALYRMKLLQFHINVLEDFEKKDKLNSSEKSGYLFWLNEEDNKRVKAWEEETGNLVYHVIKGNYNLGELLDFLYVSENENEWEMDREDLEERMPCVYSMNLSIQYHSEYGYIKISSNIGGLVRVA